MNTTIMLAIAVTISGSILLIYIGYAIGDFLGYKRGLDVGINMGLESPKIKKLNK